MEGGNKKDSPVVIALSEAALSMIMVELPNASDVALQSDNANFYRGTLILLTMCYLNLKYLGKIFVSEVAHTETQDGKSELDAHFAKSKRFLIRCMLAFDEEGNTVKKICTPDSFALSLVQDHGCPVCLRMYTCSVLFLCLHQHAQHTWAC